jgi:hypothetical protein
MRAVTIPIVIVALFFLPAFLFTKKDAPKRIISFLKPKFD